MLDLNLNLSLPVGSLLADIMTPDELIPKNWYWIRRTDGSLAPYLLHRVLAPTNEGSSKAECFVGSFLQTFPVNRIVAPANMPTEGLGG